MPMKPAARSFGWTTANRDAQERIGRTPGTTMTIEHLFSRVPARLKFLKSNQTERGHIDGIVTRYALAYPHIRFTLVHDGKVIVSIAGHGQFARCAGRGVWRGCGGADDARFRNDAFTNGGSVYARLATFAISRL